VISKTTSENDHEKTTEVISKSLRLMIILLVPIIILMSHFSKPIIEIFYGAKYLEAASSMAILVYGVGFLTIFYVMCFVMNGAGKTKISMNLSILGFTLNVILNYFLIKKYGIIGSAWATTIASFLAMLLMIFYLYREFKVFIKLKSLLKIFLTGIIIYFVSQFFPTNGVIFVFWVTLIFGFYILILIAFGEINNKDWIFLKKMIELKNKKIIDKKNE
jgi:O-antigen/teichoic acid export membrane protein